MYVQGQGVMVYLSEDGATKEKYEGEWYVPTLPSVGRYDWFFRWMDGLMDGWSQHLDD